MFPPDCKRGTKTAALAVATDNKVVKLLFLKELLVSEPYSNPIGNRLEEKRDSLGGGQSGEKSGGVRRAVSGSVLSRNEAEGDREN